MPVEQPRLAREHQECRLGRVLGRVRIAEDAPADAQHHRLVALDQHGEGRLIAVADEALEHRAVGQLAGRRRFGCRRAARLCRIRQRGHGATALSSAAALLAESSATSPVRSADPTARPACGAISLVVDTAAAPALVRSAVDRAMASMDDGAHSALPDGAVMANWLDVPAGAVGATACAGAARLIGAGGVTDRGVCTTAFDSPPGFWSAR